MVSDRVNGAVSKSQMRGSEANLQPDETVEVLTVPLKGSENAFKIGYSHMDSHLSDYSHKKRGDMISLSPDGEPPGISWPC